MKHSLACRCGVRAIVFTMFGYVLLSAGCATAGWYQIRNYEGTIGEMPVHLSLQAFDKLNGQDDAHIVGSYYYDAYHSPLKLSGERLPNGQIKLCESDPALKEEHAQPLCTFFLLVSLNAMTGTWTSGQTTFDVALHQVGDLDNTVDEKVTGRLEIPMWFSTKEAMFIGVYETPKACEKVVMSELKTISRHDGKPLANTLLAQPLEEAANMDLDCEVGLVMTEIYSNVEAGDGLHSVLIHYSGGKMGYDAIVRLPKGAY